MTSTQTFGDKLRSLDISYEKRIADIAQSFWNDIKEELETIALEKSHDATIKIVEDSEEISLLWINNKPLMIPSTIKLCKKYDLIFVKRNESVTLRFANIDFQHFEKLVKDDGCTYTYLNSYTFSISW